MNHLHQDFFHGSVLLFENNAKLYVNFMQFYIILCNFMFYALLLWWWCGTAWVSCLTLHCCRGVASLLPQLHILTQGHGVIPATLPYSSPPRVSLLLDNSNIYNLKEIVQVHIRLCDTDDKSRELVVKYIEYIWMRLKRVLRCSVKYSSKMDKSLKKYPA